MKWSNRTAQGFSQALALGYAAGERALKGRPMKAVSSNVTTRSIGHILNSIQPEFTCNIVRTPL